MVVYENLKREGVLQHLIFEISPEFFTHTFMQLNRIFTHLGLARPTKKFHINLSQSQHTDEASEGFVISVTMIAFCCKIIVFLTLNP